MSQNSDARLPAENLLVHEKSPYLRQHAHNPVHWRPWGEAALREAQALRKPILLSIGYAACHWCHVMAHESFENAETAAMMNELFINIKIDREERPDIDHLYMSALHALGEQGGWPMTMFFLPDGTPFWGGTYFPPQPAYGRPSFRQILAAIAKAFNNGDASVSNNAAAVMDALRQMNAAAPGDAITPAAALQLRDAYLRLEDKIHGGLRGAPKFPNPPIFRALWQFGIRENDSAPQEMTHRLLSAMTRGGIHDHLGGGFARYSTDAEWLAPHFEKMLYDNAQILELLSFAQRVSPEPLYVEAADGIVTWLCRDLRNAGAFAASEDADSEGEEGRFYVWAESEIDSLLSVNAAVFKITYDVTEHGNWEHKIILRRMTPPGNADTEAGLARSREILRLARAKRVRPMRDDKVLADWNGLAVAALARAAFVFERPEWLALAKEVFAATRKLLDRPDGRVAHAWCDGEVTAAGLLDDQAAMARAAIALFEATGEADYLTAAIAYAHATIAHFADDDGSFFISAADSADAPPLRPRTGADNAVPSGTGLIAEVFAKLYHLTGDEVWRDHAQLVFAAFGGEPRILGSMPTLVAAADLLANAPVFVVVGDLASAQGTALMQAAITHPDPARVVLPLGVGGDFVQTTHPGFGKSVPMGEQAAVYVCRAGVCGLPVTEADAI